MKIRLDAVVPKPLEGTFNSESIWGKQLELLPEHKYLIKADSGKGKSTLLAYIYGLRRDYNGNIWLNEFEAKSLSLSLWSELRVSRLSILFQDLRLFEHLSAWENIMIKHQLNPVLNNNEINSLAERLGVYNLLQKKVKFLSMGQQQRIALLRALVQPFEFLLLDEPFSHLDQTNQGLMEEVIIESCNRNRAGLIITSLGNTGSIEFNEILKV